MATRRSPHPSRHQRSNRRRSTRGWYLLFPLLFLALAGCGGGGDSTLQEEEFDQELAGLGEVDEAPPNPEVEAGDLLTALEDRLLLDTGVNLPFLVTSQGEFEADLAGVLILAPGGRVRLEYTGSFGGEGVEGFLVSDGNRMRWEGRVEGGEADAPPFLREALVVGLVRMGILHNLARLVAGFPPDATDGSVRSWVEATEPAHGGTDPEVPVGVAVRFGIRVGGEPSGEATLWLDPASDVPLLRRQMVRFPRGEMQVTERYSNPVADVEVPDSILSPPAC